MNYLSNNKRIFIKNLFIIYLISFFTIPLFTNDGDTGFRKKRFYLEATYGLSYGLNGSMVGFMNDNNKLKIPAFVEPDDYLVYSFTQTPANRPSLRSTSNNLLFEYGLSDKWGLGFTVHREMYDVKNYSTSNYAENYFLTSLLFGNNMNGQEAIIAASLNKRYAGIKENIQILGIGTIDINLAYHFFSNRKFDPYIRFGLGKGIEMFSSSDVTRLTTTIGSRYFFHENFYLLGEMQIAHHEINRHSNGGFLSKPVPHGTLNEGYLQVGLGVSVGEFWKTQKSEPIKELDTPVTKPVERKEEIVQKPDPDVRNYQEIISEIKKIAQENNLELRSRNGKLTIIFLNDALFDSGSDKINPKGEKSVINLAKIINKFEGIKFTIEGHTDNVPIRTLNKYANNEELSLARADAVKYILISEGVSESRLDTKGLGDTHPYKSNNTPEGRQANRRIEIVADKDISEIPELKGLVDK